MATKAQTCALCTYALCTCAFCTCAFAPLHLSRVLYKSTLFMQNKANLLDALMNVTYFITTDYLNKCLRQPPKNEPNTNPIRTQYKANTNPIPERPKMNENLFATKVYENITTFRLEQNKPNQTQLKPISEAKKCCCV